MIELKVNNEIIIEINDFVESVDFIDDTSEHIIKIFFDTLNPFGENSMEYLSSILPNTSILTFIQDGVEILIIDKEIKLSRLARETRRNKFILTATFKVA